MRTLVSGLVVLLVVVGSACLQSPEDTGGQKTNVAGTQGPIGPQGLQGPQGVPGADGKDGVSAVSVIPLSTGVCANGGVRLLDRDGGSAVVCNGRDGATGAQGATGTTGAQGPIGPVGPQGPAPAMLNVFTVDGKNIGYIFSPDSNTGNFLVYLNEVEILAMLDWAHNTVVLKNQPILYSEDNCTGIEFVPDRSISFPLAGIALGVETYRVKKPVVIQIINAKSRRSLQVGADGGPEVWCTVYHNTEAGAAVELFNMPTYSGPFSFGSH